MKFYSIFVALLILLSPGIYGYNFKLICGAVAQASEVTEQQVAELYVATFNRAPDKPGLDFWVNDSGFTIEQIAESFFDQSETQSLYPLGTTETVFVTSVYGNLFNRAPGAAGLDYWADALGSGAITRPVMIEAVKNGAQGTDAQIVANKAEVGLYYASLGLEGGGFSLADVTNDSATVTAAISAVDGSVVSDNGVVIPTAPKDIIWNQTSNSITLEHDAIGAFEGYSSFDFDGNGQKSFFFPPGNDSHSPKSPSDQDFLVFKVSPDNSLMMAPSPLTTKYVPGHVNDDILMGKFGNSATDSLIFIDHGREPQDLPASQWPHSYLWRIDKVNGSWEVTEFAKDIGKQFWHSSSNPIDINGDGVLDFSVAALSQITNVLFLSNSNTGQHDGIELALYLTENNCGSSALIHLANGHIGSICLPYTPHTPYTFGDIGQVFTLSLDGKTVESIQDVMVRNTPTTQGMNDHDGYNLIRVLDLNNDGLEDFLGFAEANDGSSQKSKKIIAFLQDKNSQFYQANQQLGISFVYSLPNPSSEFYADGVESNAIISDVNGDNLQDIIIPTHLITHDHILSKGIRGGYVQKNGTFVDLKIPSEKILWNKESVPYDYRYVLPTEINSDGIVDFVLVGSTYDQTKTSNNPYGTLYHLTILKSEIQN